MEYLAQSINFLEATKGKNEKEIVLLIIQVLHSLIYLHRRNLLHRDLKPSNIMVHNGIVKVLDFGISQIILETQKLKEDLSGSVIYMAPELLQNKEISRSSDLYTLGLIAFEAIAGKLPFDRSSIGIFIAEKINKDVEFDGVEITPKLKIILEKLLQRNPKHRYQKANEVIIDLCEALDIPIPKESSEIRESFLQAAKFVGRENEMEILSGALLNSSNGVGGTWLVGGESGVGKTRLLEELRTISMVEGSLVFHGQTIKEGGSPYHPWKNIFKHLVIYGKLTEEEISVLKPYVSSIEELLNKVVPDLIPLAPNETQNRLISILISILEKFDRDLVIILEDLQWADSGSIAILEKLTKKLKNQSVLIIGNFRNDETPHLSAEIPGIEYLELDRLGEDAISELSVAMLGQAGKDIQIIEFLDRETEGNPFFLVETVRALAEQAGDLRGIGKMDLPEKIFSGGVHEIVQRRIRNVNKKMLPLLNYAAISGRQVDLPVLNNLREDIVLDEWIRDCSESAVLEMSGGNWRFSHDKLRETLLQNIEGPLLAKLNRDVAESIEEVHTDDPLYYAALASHWVDAGDKEQSIKFNKLAGEMAMSNNAMAEGENYLITSLEWLLKIPKSIERDQQELELQILLGSLYFGFKGWGAEEIKDIFESVIALSKKLKMGKTPPVALNGLWAYYFVNADYEKAESFLRIGLNELDKEEDKSILELMYHNGLVANYSMMGDFENSMVHAEKVFKLYDHELHHNTLVLLNTIDLAGGATHAWAIWNYISLGFPEKAEEISARALEIVGINNHPHTKIFLDAYILVSKNMKREFSIAVEKGKEVIKFGTETHSFPVYSSMGIIDTGFAMGMLGDNSGMEKLLQGVALEEVMTKMFLIRDYSYLSIILSKENKLDEAIEYSKKAIELIEKTQTNIYGAESYRIYGDILLQSQAQLVDVESAYQKSLIIARSQKAKWWELRTSVSLAKLWRSKGKIWEAKELLQPVFEWFTEGFDTIDLKEAKILLDELSN